MRYSRKKDCKERGEVCQNYKQIEKDNSRDVRSIFLALAKRSVEARGLFGKRGMDNLFSSL